MIDYNDTIHRLPCREWLNVILLMLSDSTIDVMSAIENIEINYEDKLIKDYKK